MPRGLIGPALVLCAAACVAIAGARAQDLPQPSALESEAAAPAPFWTQHAYFVPSRFSDLPGWRDDKLGDAWKAFRESCRVLASRAAWAGSCARAVAIDLRSDADIRRFVEREFALYEIRDSDRSPLGTITGYYEPLLNGSRRYEPGFPYPIYGVPKDLLYLDSRSLPIAGPAGLRVRIDGRNVVPDSAGLALDIGDARPDVRDKKIRVRVDGSRIVPYYTREEIERGVMTSAGVIAWVDDSAALYSLHVQGSGKVRLPDGQIVRVAYAEQNGHPFTPPSRKRVRTRGLDSSEALWVRGFDIPLADEAAEAPASPDRASAAARTSTRGLQPLAETTASGRPADANKEELSPEVAQMVEFLLKGTGETAVSHTAPPRSDAVTKGAKGREPAPKADKPTAASGAHLSTAPPPVLTRPSIFSSDPSYVFFRQIPDSEAGPIGALGVPLTPGRSVAVDPRTTPLGSPVFIATDGQTPDTRVNRLMLAQDTGGAIRGAVRADYFWGFGAAAFQRASRMKESGRMWLLLPKDLRIAAAAQSIRSRGLGGGAATPECLVADPEFCVE